MAVDMLPVLAYAPATVAAIPSLVPLVPFMVLPAVLFFGVSP